MPWAGDVHSCASTTAARVYSSVPGSGLPAAQEAAVQLWGSCAWLLERLRYTFSGIKGAIDVK